MMTEDELVARASVRERGLALAVDVDGGLGRGTGGVKRWGRVWGAGFVGGDGGRMGLGAWENDGRGIVLG